MFGNYVMEALETTICATKIPLHRKNDATKPARKGALDLQRATAGTVLVNSQW